MTFAERRIDVRFALAKTTFPNGEQLLDLAHHRVQVNIANNGGGMAMPTLSLRIFGMKLADMGALATRGLTGLAVNGDQVTVMAGNAGGLLNTIFVGTIVSAVPDFAGSPEVSFVVNATSGFFERIQAAPPNSYPGPQDVASIIGGLAKQAGFAFQNHGVTAKISGQYLGGTLMDQIERVAGATQTLVLLDQQVVHIWPNGGSPDFPEVTLSPETGMKGYPTFTTTGIEVSCEWHPALLFGTKVNVASSVPMASGTWQVQRANHDLSTLTPDGPWFSILNLSPLGYLSVNPN
ncbi:hypothetical protein WK39_27990 [Burkholderia cepacia]|uniref:baseplate hub protein n=2 Tax=Burkholderia cepacia complex TaxID=87882 RepID=UPI0007520CC1|nr:hypothetical protein [Burkholderia cepacia]KVS50705.1 hypothetical protein WK39_27990 [Burkholderia cepacia]KVS65731.1 hypothetical protein WK40_12300 [Burkholderia cepacia]